MLETIENHIASFFEPFMNSLSQSHRKYIIITGAFILPIVTTLIVFSILKSGKKPSEESQPQPTPTTASQQSSNSVPLEDLLNKRKERIGVKTKSEIISMYVHQVYSKEKKKYDPDIYYYADLRNSSQQPFLEKNYPSYISPHSTYFAQVGKKTIAISSKPSLESPAYKTIVTIADNVPEIKTNTIFWSSEDSKLAYAVSIFDVTKESGTNKVITYEDMQYFVIDADGQNKKQVGTFTNYPGGTMLGYDFEKNIVYATKNNTAASTQTVFALKGADNKVNELFTVPLSVGISMTQDAKQAFYSDDLATITQVNLNTIEKKSIINLKSLSPMPAYTAVKLWVYPDSSHLLFALITADNKIYKYIMDLNSKAVDSVLTSDQYLSYYPDPLHPISPDNKYIFLETQEQTIHDMSSTSPSSEFLSGRYCIWDGEAHSMIPFFNCPASTQGTFKDIQNEKIIFLGWYLK